MRTMTIVVSAPDQDIKNAPTTARLKPPSEFRAIEMTDAATHMPVLCQWEAKDGSVLLSWTEDSLAKGRSKTYEVTFTAAPPRPTGESGVQMKTDVDGRLDVLVGGNRLTSYHYGPRWHRPYFHPLIGPFGDPVTRGYPMVEGAPGETTDHVHHRGVWTGHGAVNGVDNWGEETGAGRTVHREFAALHAGTVYGRAVALSDWITSDGRAVLLRERREMTFHNVAPSRLIDIDITLTALDRDVVFGDTKEAGIIAVRVASSMDVPRGGRIVNSHGAINEKAVWGQRAGWCDYTGQVNGNQVGVAVFDHPASFGHPTFWHARDYGLMVTNPFGTSDFGRDGWEGEHILQAGESLSFRNRLYVHSGGAAEAGVAEKYDNYAGPPKVEVT